MKTGNTPKTNWCQKSSSSSLPLKTTQGKTAALRPLSPSISCHHLIWVLKVIYSNIRGKTSKVHLADKDAIADRNVVPGAKLQICILPSPSLTHRHVDSFFSPPPPLFPCHLSVLLNSVFSPVFSLSSHFQLCLPLPHHAPLLLSVLTSAYTSPSLFPPRQLLLDSLLPPSS